MVDWPSENEWERCWWGNCQNTYGEEAKQLVYANFMKLSMSTNSEGSPCIDAGGQRILDIGGGPVSLLLKCFNLAYGLVVDPCPYPDWVRARYDAAKILVAQMKAENLHEMVWGAGTFDEVWIYNCLQHVEDPCLILRHAKRIGSKKLRIFEWVEVPVCPGHPHVLTQSLFDREIGKGGSVYRIGDAWAMGLAYCAVIDLGG